MTKTPRFGAIGTVSGRPPKLLVDPPNRIQELRVARKLSQAAVADLCDWPDRQKVQKLEQGKQRLTVADAIVLAKVLGVGVEQLRPAGDENRNTVPIIGYVGAGEIVEYFDDQSPMDWIEPPLGADVTGAVIVRGGSMQPRYFEGEILFFKKSIHGVPRDALGYDCIVQVTGGRAFVKRLFRGSRDDVYRLRSVNGADMEDVALDWASQVLWTKQRR